MTDFAHHMYAATPAVHGPEPYHVSHAINHNHGDIITPMTEMIDSAVDNMNWGM